MRIAKSQTVCEWVKVAPIEPVPGSKLGLALNTLGAEPINGLRVAPTDTTNGWYIWCGKEMSREPDFFSPLHVEHIADYVPAVAQYLALPPGYRFLIDGSNYEDVWFDEQLLQEAP